MSSWYKKGPNWPYRTPDKKEEMEQMANGADLLKERLQLKEEADKIFDKILLTPKGSKIHEFLLQKFYAINERVRKIVHREAYKKYVESLGHKVGCEVPFIRQIAWKHSPDHEHGLRKSTGAKAC